VTVAAVEDRIPPGPILIVADNAAITHWAPDWGRRFAAAGRVHRVRLAGRGDTREVAAVAAEAASLGAVAILAAGDRPALELGARVAALLNLPLAAVGNSTMPSG